MTFDNEKAPGLGTGGQGAAASRSQGNQAIDFSSTIAPGDPGTKEKLLVPDTDGALEFLGHWRPGGPWVLTAIPPDGGGTETRTFDAQQHEIMRAWIDARQEQQNLYFSVNDPACLLTSKAKKADIAFARALHVDIDPRVNEDIDSERARALRLLRVYDPPPTVIIDSGGGYQGFWLLSEPVPIPDVERDDKGGWSKLEGRNLTIEAALQADACHNLDRIMRLPGTINVPGEKKRKKGRVPALARVVEADWSRRYGLEDFLSAGNAGTSPKVEVTATPTADVDLEALPVPDKVRALIVQGDDPDDPARWADRSKAVWHVTCELIRAGVDDAVILGVLLDPDLGISAHVREQPRPEPYARRQIERAREASPRGNADDFDRIDGKIIANSQRNIRLAIRKLGVRVRYDLFARRAKIEGLEGFGPHIDDAATIRLWLLIDEWFGFRPTRELFDTVLSDAARRDSFHPVRDYLDGLTWDRTPRLEGWLTTYGKAPDTPYTRAISRLVLIAAVRRVRQPGAKFDEMLVLESPQGKDKSSALALLAVNDNWFTDSLPLNADDKLTIERTSGKWIVEAGELNGITKAGVSKLKNLLSKQKDEARMAYGRNQEVVFRQWIMVGTTNNAQYLRDQTGNRRFWPVRVEAFDLEALRRNRDQLWAEAAHLEAQGVSIRLDPSLWDAAAAEQDARRIEDPFYETLHDTLGEVDEGKVRGEHVWAILDRPAGQRSQHDNERMGDAMRRLGFRRRKMRFGDKNVWGYQRGDSNNVLWEPGCSSEPPF